MAFYFFLLFIVILVRSVEKLNQLDDFWKTFANNADQEQEQWQWNNFSHVVGTDGLSR